MKQEEQGKGKEGGWKGRGVEERGWEVKREGGMDRERWGRGGK